MKLPKVFMCSQGDFKPSALQKELKATLTPHEKVEKTYLLTQNIFVFTDKRLIIGDPVGFSEIQFPCHSIPYRSVTHFSLSPLQDSSSGMVLSIWLHGDSQPLQIVLEDSPAIPELHRSLAEYVLNRHSPWLNKQLMWKKESGLKTVRTLGFTGAAVLAAVCLSKKHGKMKAALSDKMTPAAMAALILKKLRA